MIAPVPIETAISERALLGAALGGDLSTWATWIAVLKAAYGRQLTATEREAFATVAGDREPPRRKVRELVCVASRRAGKGRAGAALAVFEAALVDHSGHLAPGETGVVACISPTRAQAAIMLNYCRGYLEASPVLRGEVLETTGDEIRLRNGVVIATLASDFRTLRGRTLLLAIMDEAAFLRDEQSAAPDIECARALLPGLATTDGMLAILSSPYRRSGLLHQRHRDYFGKDEPTVLVVAGASETFNPTLSAAMLADARAADPLAATSEWDGQFRSDLAAFLDEASIERAIDPDRPLEIAPESGIRYFAFTDASAGRHDAFTLCVGHRDGERIVCDVIRGRRPPFDPSMVALEYALLARSYGCSVIEGDNYAGQWVAGAFVGAGIEYRRSPLTRSEIYLEGLPVFMRGLISIPDHKPLVRELRLLERRTARSGKDSVDHGAGAGSSDDYSNSLFGMMRLARAPSVPLMGVILFESAGPRRTPGSGDLMPDYSAGRDFRGPDDCSPLIGGNGQSWAYRNPYGARH